MKPEKKQSPDREQADRNRKRSGFTLVEVMVAMTVMSLVLFSSIGASTIGFRLLEDARFGTLASQVLQSEMENLRLKNWTQVTALPSSGSFTPDAGMNTTSFNRFSCNRAISTVRSDVRQVILTASWRSTDGRLHQRRYLTYITRNGLNDYFYRKI